MKTPSMNRERAVGVKLLMWLARNSTIRGLISSGRHAARIICLLVVGVIAAACFAQEAASPLAEGTADVPQDPSPSARGVPDGILEGGTGWLNTSKPISLQDLRGKVVVLDFWTYCCINCMHVLPDLRFLEEKYPNELVVIGVHSAKFDNEKDSEAIRNAIMRHGIAHPVVNDSEMLIWRKFGVRAWPTLALVDPQGRYLGSRGGEGNRDVFDDVIGKVIKYHRSIGKLNEEPIQFELETATAAPTPLRYPGKVLADETSGRLFISDTSHNRLVITTLDGQVQDVIGSGIRGGQDGTFADSQFDHPQGTCLVGSILYVADTGNHLIRSIDLESKTVSTFAGTGLQSRPRAPTGSLRETALNSPWAICHVDGVMYLAMAGPHQIWSHPLGTDTITVFAGNGREDVINGPLPESSFAQPSGLVVSSESDAVFVVDSEGSSIRRVAVTDAGVVTTIAGTSELPRGQSLFAFGDVDASGADARFQHPIGIARHENILYVADSYNHKIRAVDSVTGAVTTWLGNGQAGDAASMTQLNEPAGLSVAGGTLYVADTNSHRICAVDLESRELRVLQLGGLEPPPHTANRSTNTISPSESAVEAEQ